MALFKKIGALQLFLYQESFNGSCDRPNTAGPTWPLTWPLTRPLTWPLTQSLEKAPAYPGFRNNLKF